MITVAGCLSSAGGVLYLDGDVHVDVIDGGVHLSGLVPEPVDLSVVSLDPSILFRLAACLMIAADQLTTTTKTRQPGGVVGVPH